MTFERDRYVIVKNLVSDEIANIATQYALFDMINNFDGGDDIVPGSHCRYSDSLMESILLHVKPVVEKHSGKRLIPTYTYFRVYKPGDTLRDHTDRPSCEISSSITMGFRYNDVHEDYRWSLHGYVNGEKRYFRCEAGDGIIYKGIELEHGRDQFEAGKFSYHVQVFLHYVDADGPYAEEFKYDKRPSIGIKKEKISYVT
jgi:hypothetical protein